MMDFANPHFEEPRWLLLAVGAPLLLAGMFRYAAIARHRQLAQIASPRFIEELTKSHSAGRRTLKNLLLLLSVGCVGLALARPQWGELQMTGQSSGEDVMFALDCSKSMLATDILPNRLQRSKLAILDFVRRHGRGRVGLVAFAGSAFLQCPLTHDYDAFDQALQAVDEKSIPVAGTDIGRALNEGYRAMDKSSRRKAIVLVTDGEDLEKSGVKVAESLATNGVVVFAVGVGTQAGAEIRIQNKLGQQELLRDAKGAAVRSHLDEGTLQAIAKSTGGNYHPLGARGEGLVQVRLALETLGRADNAIRVHGVERFHVPIAAALLLMVLESLIGTRRNTRSHSDGLSHGGHQAALITAILICISGNTFGATNDATNAAAIAPPAPAPKTAREFYNAGTQKLNQGKLSDAESFLRSALITQEDPIQPEALYNLGHVRFAQGEELLKKGPSPESLVTRNRIVGQRGAQVAQQAREALAENDMKKMVEAYVAGRGVRKEARAVIEAFNQAMDDYGATLLKWQRSLGDFRSVMELNPADTNAVRNAQIVEEAIAKLVDSIRKMQQAMMPVPGQGPGLMQVMDQLKGRIPDEMMPPGGTGDDDEDFPMARFRGEKEGPSRDGTEQLQGLSPKEAGDLLEGLRLGEKQGLPIGSGNAEQSRDRKGRDW